jgi:hypothetical protein
MKKTLIISLLSLVFITGCGGSSGKKAVCKATNSNSFLESKMTLEYTFNSGNTRIDKIEKTMIVEMTDLEYVKQQCGNLEVNECIKRIAEETKEGVCKEKESYQDCGVKNVTDHGYVVYATIKTNDKDEMADGIKIHQSKEELINSMKKDKNITCE